MVVEFLFMRSDSLCWHVSVARRRHGLNKEARYRISVTYGRLGWQLIEISHDCGDAIDGLLNAALDQYEHSGRYRLKTAVSI